MEYIYMPSILIVNLVILSAIGFPLVSWAVRKVAPPGQGGRRRLLSFAGVVLLLGVGAWTALLVQSGFYKISVANIAHGGYEAYSEFRPVRFTFKDLHYDCTPSTFWFKDGWRPRGEKVVGNTN